MCKRRRSLTTSTSHEHPRRKKTKFKECVSSAVLVILNESSVSSNRKGSVVIPRSLGVIALDHFGSHENGVHMLVDKWISKQFDHVHIHDRLHFALSKMFDVMFYPITLLGDCRVCLFMIVGEDIHSNGLVFYQTRKQDYTSHSFYKIYKTLDMVTLDEPETVKCHAFFLLDHVVSNEKNDYNLRMCRAVNVFSHYNAIAANLDKMGCFYLKNGAFEDAAKAFSEAIKVREAACGDTSEDAIVSRCLFGQTLQHLGQLDKAQICYQLFLVFACKNARMYRREIEIVSRNLAEIYHVRGEIKEAERFYRISLEVGKTSGYVRSEIASTLNRLGNLFYESNKLHNALACYVEGFIIERLLFTTYNRRMVVTLTNIAQIHFRLGDYSTALQIYKEINNLQIGLHGPMSPEVVKTMSAMGEAEYRMKNYESAFALFHGVLMIQRSTLKDDFCMTTAFTLNSMGIVSYAMGKIKAAKDFFLESLAIRKVLLGANHEECATLYYNLATTFEQEGDEDMAEQLYIRSLRIERNSPTTSHIRGSIDTMQRIGRLYEHRGNLHEAIRFFTEALSLHRSQSNGEDSISGKILNLIGNIHLQLAEVDKMMVCFIQASRTYREAHPLGHHALVILGFNWYSLSRIFPPSAAAA